MENGTSLDDILSNEPTEVTEQAETISRDEQGRFAAKEEPGENLEKLDVSDNQPTDSGPPPQEQEPAHIPMAALKDERTKRQQLEEQYRQAAERLQQYETYFQQLNAYQEEQGPPDPQTDPAGYAQYVSEQARSAAQANVQQYGQQYIVQARADVSEMLARQKWADYDEKVNVFKEAVASNPFLVQELHNAPDPATYAYNAATKILEARTYGSNTGPSREQLEAEIREKIMAEIGINRPQVPTTLANERSVGSRSGPGWSGPTPLNDLIG